MLGRKEKGKGGILSRSDPKHQIWIPKIEYYLSKFVEELLLQLVLYGIRAPIL